MSLNYFHASLQKEEYEHTHTHTNAHMHTYTRAPPPHTHTRAHIHATYLCRGVWPFLFPKEYLCIKERMDHKTEPSLSVPPLSPWNSETGGILFLCCLPHTSLLIAIFYFPSNVNICIILRVCQNEGHPWSSIRPKQLRPPHPCRLSGVLRCKSLGKSPFYGGK